MAPRVKTTIKARLLGPWYKTRDHDPMEITVALHTSTFSYTRVTERNHQYWHMANFIGDTVTDMQLAGLQSSEFSVQLYSR